MLKISPRGRHITQEPQTIAPHLLGSALASFRRRLLAFTIDVILFGAVIGCLFVGMSYLSFDREDPTFFDRVKAARAETDPGRSEEMNSQVLVDFLIMVDGRCPEALPCEAKQFLEEENYAGLEEFFDSRDMTVGFGSGPTRASFTNEVLTMSIGTDLLLGSGSSFFSWGAFFVGWFTLWTRLGRGRTLGKMVLGIRVITLDGRTLRWWDSFSRAGGYGASAATLFLGFLEAIWHPNRQVIHDRISGTVVIRG